MSVISCEKYRSTIRKYSLRLRSIRHLPSQHGCVTIAGKSPFKGTEGLQEMYTDFDRWIVKFTKIMKRSLNLDKKGALIEHVKTTKSKDNLKNFLSEFLPSHLQSLAVNGEEKENILKKFSDKFHIDGTQAMFYDYVLFRLCDESFRFFEYKSKL